MIQHRVTGGELFARVAECERLSEEEASNFVEQILLGVQHMHQLGVVHLDLKPENIMIEDLASRKIKIIDFGLARVLNPMETFQDMAGTPEFCAPEIINYDPITLATDMWAIGVITYILLSGISPFAGDSQAETFRNIQDCLVDYNREEICHATNLAKDFIRRLLVKVPRKRATVHECLQHSWIKPSNSDQQSYRRGSLISRTNLDGLRHFIAVPTGVEGQMPERDSDGFEMQKTSHDLEDTLGYNSENDKNREYLEEKTTSIDGPGLHVQKFHSHPAQKSSFDENHTTTSRTLIPNETNEAKSNSCPVERSVQQSGDRNQENRISVHQPVPGKSGLGGWRASKSHGLISRLGAAFYGNSGQKTAAQQTSQNHRKATSKLKHSEGKSSIEKCARQEASQAVDSDRLSWTDHADPGQNCLIASLASSTAAAQTVPEQSVHSQKQYRNKHKHDMSSKPRLEGRTSPRSTSLDHKEGHSHSNPVSLSETRQSNTEHCVGQTSAPTSVLEGNKCPPELMTNMGGPVQRGPQFGNVSRAIKEFETSVVDTAFSTSETYTESLGNSISQPINLPRRIWDSHKPAKQACAGNYNRPRERNRDQVGRLQVFFETVSSHRGGTLNSISARNSKRNSDQLEGTSSRRLSATHR